tara:strand:- start:676 stop:1233 length:558 start_codon:yes stop_codon:yes gene_type:complete
MATATRVVTDTPNSFTVVDFSEGAPNIVICTSPTASFYKFLHNLDAESYPLSTRIFHDRMELHKFGIENVYDNVWGYNPLQAIWKRRDTTTDQWYVSAFIVNELYEPRFGKYVCLDKDVVELDVRPVPCFFKAHGYGSIQYCGTWTFARQLETPEPFLYVLNGRERVVVYTVSLTSYDDRWGPRA